MGFRRLHQRSAAPRVRSRTAERTALRDKPWAEPVTRRVESGRTTAREGHERVRTRSFDESRSLADMLDGATGTQRDLVRISSGRLVPGS
jgi:hypothetical protein